MLGILHETVISDADRPTLLFLFATMVGLPAFLRQDEQHLASEEDEPAKPKKTARPRRQP